MTKTNKSYRFSNMDISNIEALKKSNPYLSETDIVSFSLSISRVVSDLMNEYSNIEEFHIDDDSHLVELVKRIIK